MTQRSEDPKELLTIRLRRSTLRSIERAIGSRDGSHRTSVRVAIQNAVETKYGKGPM